MKRAKCDCDRIEAVRQRRSTVTYRTLSMRALTSDCSVIHRNGQMSPVREKQRSCHSVTVYSPPCSLLAPVDYRDRGVILVVRFRFSFRDGFVAVGGRTAVFAVRAQQLRLHNCVLDLVCCWPRRTVRSRCPNGLSRSFGFQSDYPVLGIERRSASPGADWRRRLRHRSPVRPPRVGHPLPTDSVRPRRLACQ